MGYGLGIDCGTTHTAAAILRGGRPEVLGLGQRRPAMPSLVFVPADGPVLVGEAAARRGQADPSRLARAVKRRMGDPVPLLVGGSPFSAHALTARLLAYVLHTAATAEGEPPSSVVITCPANWGPYKRELLEHAAALADLPPATLLTEPEAAAIEFAAGERVSEGEVIAVYDLGGGTFDAAVLRRSGSGFTVLGEPMGIEQLGGIDFDEAVVDHVLQQLPADRLSEPDAAPVEALERLRRDCVEAKEALSEDTEVQIPVALPGLHRLVRLTRGEFEAMIRPALHETIAAVHRTLRSASVEPNDLRAVVLSGGSARIPLVTELLLTTFRRPVLSDPHPELSIARGAARVAGAAAAGSEPPSPPPGGRVDGEAGSGHRPVTGTAIVAPDRSGDSPGNHSPTRRPRRPGVRRRGVLVLVAAVAVLGAASAAIALINRPTDSSGGSWTSSPQPPTSLTPTAASCGFVDDFDGSVLNSSWERTRPDAELRLTGGGAELSAPDGADIYNQYVAAPMLLQEVTGDFVLETDVTARPAQLYQGAGLVLWNGRQSYVRLEHGFGDVSAIAFEYKDNGAHTRVHSPRRGPSLIQTDADRIVLQLSRTGQAISARWRPADEPAFRELEAITVGIPSTVRIGVSILNRAQGGAKPTTFTARFDRVTASC